MALASDLKSGSYFIFQNEPHRVLKKGVVVFGTHSHSKLKFTVQSLFTKTEKVVNFAHQDRVEVLDVIRKSGTVISRTMTGFQIMDPVTFLTFDAERIPVLEDEITEGDEVTFVELPEGVKIIEKR